MTFQYDVEGRLSRAFQTGAPAQGATYGYDTQNRLASRTMTSGATTTTTLYIHDLDDHIIAETNTAGVTLREYVWLNDMPVAVVNGVNTAAPVVYYVHTDHLGRPARMIAQSWAWVWDVIYSPFGAPAAIFDATAKLDMRFPGQWLQMESGLAYNWHRHYDASLGRYVQPDPIGYAGGRSLYGYVGQNPLAYVDPKGRTGVLAAGVIEGAEIGGAIAGPVGAVAGAIVVGVGGYLVGDYLGGLVWASSPAEKEKCPCGPCKTVSGRVVPVGTVAYRPLDTPSKPEHGIVGPHYNIYKANQNPKNCQCFWQSIGAVQPHDLPAGAIPIEPFAK